MRTGFNLSNRFYWSSHSNLFFSIIIPSVISIIVCIVFSFMEGFVDPILVFPCISYMSVFCINLISLPSMIFLYKKKDVLKRIQSSKLDFFEYVVGCFLFYIVIGVISYFINCVIICTVVSVCGHDLWKLWAAADWWGIIYTLFITLIATQTIGLFIGLFCNSIHVIRIIGFSLLLLNMFLGYWLLPAALLLLEPGGNLINTISNFWLFGHISKMFLESWIQDPSLNMFQTNIFQYNNDFVIILDAATIHSAVTISSVSEKVINMFFPLGCIVLVLSATTISFITRRKL